jgi:hypothetical protein
MDISMRSIPLYFDYDRVVQNALRFMAQVPKSINLWLVLLELAFLCFKILSHDVV